MILTWGDLFSNWSIMQQENNENREKSHFGKKEKKGKKNQRQPRNQETSKDICQTPVLY